ncbi:thioredoxin-like protein [Melanogaster broomeanus]|nr:thioredoxin-like protein [Melanogaster broomeanus]
MNGKLLPKLKSQPIPETQDESVFNLVGEEFEEVVFDDSKDVFVEFYAPSFVFVCFALANPSATWDSLGDYYADVNDQIVIAKMDALENDLPGSVSFHINAYPTLKFKPAGSHEFIDYYGDRTLESLVSFVEEHAMNDWHRY